MTISIIGLGLIGGSIALECKALGHRVIGVENNPDHGHQASDKEIIHELKELDEAVSVSDMIVVAIPVDQIEELVPILLDNIPAGAVIFDVGSTKKAICDRVKIHPNRGRFVAAHPLSGTEFSGPKAALMNLFKGKKNIVCEEHLSDEDALESILELFTDMGMQTLFMDPEEHDKHMAYVSHLSHVSSFTLSMTVLDIEKDEKQIFNLASTGLESTVRLAKSSPDTWTSIFMKNNKHLSAALEEYIAHLQAFKDIIDNRDAAASKELMKKANEIKRVLKGMKLNIVKLS